MLAALIVMVQGGSTVLVNPQEPVLKMLSHTRTTEMFTIQTRRPARIAPGTGARVKALVSTHSPCCTPTARSAVASA